MEPELELPDLHEAILDAQTLRAYATDLLDCAVIFDLQLKRAPQAYVPDSASALSLDEALSALERREALGLQVRYLWQEKVWLDTLMWTAQGLRLVRIQPLTAPRP